MSKTVPVKDIGVPLPADTSKVAGVVCYYGPKGFTPSYNQSARVIFVVSTLQTVPVGTPPVSYYDVPIGPLLPSTLPDAAYDFVFTFVDANGAESDFSVAVTETLDLTVPPQPGQPVVLS